jgi:hypothetical protein
MYEKPQYLTPDGYKRSRNNPNKETPDEAAEIRKTLQDYKAKQKQKEMISRINAPATPSLSPVPARLSAPRKKGGISEKSAQLIAMAIKDLLRNK